MTFFIDLAGDVDCVYLQRLVFNPGYTQWMEIGVARHEISLVPYFDTLIPIVADSMLAGP